MYCTKCGAEILEENGAFCSKCGQAASFEVAGMADLGERGGRKVASTASDEAAFISVCATEVTLGERTKKRNSIAIGLIAAMIFFVVAVLVRCCMNDGFDIDFNVADELQPAQEMAARNSGRVAIFNGSVIGVSSGACDDGHLASFYDLSSGVQNKASLNYLVGAEALGVDKEKYHAAEKKLMLFGKTEGVAKVAAFSGNELTSVLLGDSGCAYWCNAYSQRNRVKVADEGWDSCIGIAAGNGYVLGLHADGTVVAIGANEQGQCDVGDWSDIKQLCSDGATTYGLRNHGTVLIAGENESNSAAEAVHHWKNIVQIAASSRYVVGVRSDGTVVKCSLSPDADWLNTGTWNRVVAVSVSDDHAIGLKDDGSIVTAGNNSQGQCSLPEGVSNEGFVAMATGPANTILVKEQGDVVWMGAFRDEYVWSDGYRFYKPKFTNLGDARYKGRG